MVVMVLVPCSKDILPDAVPDVTATPFTFTVAPATVTVGVTVMDEVRNGTEAV